MADRKRPGGKATPARQKSSGAKTGLILGIVGAAVVALLVAVVVFGNEEIIESSHETADVALDGVSLPAMPQNTAQDTSATGLTPPALTGTDFEGNTVSITNDGRAKAVLFLAHWCGNCQEEVPRVQAWLNGGGGVEGVDLYSVTTAVRSTSGNYPPSAWLEREGWTLPVVRDDSQSSAHRAFGGGGFPYWVFINSDGTVALRTAGQLQTEQLVGILESLN
jgi:thiol-disulfide isomerase/thioredoxin